MVAVTTKFTGYTRTEKALAFAKGIFSLAPLVEVAVAGLRKVDLPREQRLKYAQKVAKHGAEPESLLRLLSTEKDHVIQNLLAVGFVNGAEASLNDALFPVEFYAPETLDLFPQYGILNGLSLRESQALRLQTAITDVLHTSQYLSTESKENLTVVFKQCGDTVIDCRLQKRAISLPNFELQ